jgi:hypothetical protein
MEADKDLNSSDPVSLSSDFETYLNGFSFCLKNSGFLREVCPIVSKYIYFANQGRRIKTRHLEI